MSEGSDRIVRKETVDEEFDENEEVRKETMEEEDDVTIEDEEYGNEVTRRDVREPKMKKKSSKKGAEIF